MVMSDSDIFIISSDELMNLSLYVNAISAIGIIVYIFLTSFVKSNAAITSLIGRFLYSVLFSIATYSVTYYIFYRLNIKLGFSDISPVGIVSTLFIYVGTSYFNKNIDIH